MVLAFEERALAERVQRDLVTGGYDEQDAMLFDAGDVIPGAQKQLENADWLARLGRADEMVQTHLNARFPGGGVASNHLPATRRSPLRCSEARIEREQLFGAANPAQCVPPHRDEARALRLRRCRGELGRQHGAAVH